MNNVCLQHVAIETTVVAGGARIEDEELQLVVANNFSSHTIKRANLRNVIKSTYPYVSNKNYLWIHI